MLGFENIGTPTPNVPKEKAPEDRTLSNTPPDENSKKQGEIQHKELLRRMFERDVASSLFALGKDLPDGSDDVTRIEQLESNKLDYIHRFALEEDRMRKGLSPDISARMFGPDTPTRDSLTIDPMLHRLVRSGFQEKVLRTRNENLSQEIEKARKDSKTDSLTGLCNRAAYTLEITKRNQEARLASGERRAKSKENSAEYSLIYLDIDHFKAVNDTYGHAGGDNVIRAVAKVLKSSIREADFVARVGGEEFAIICPGSVVDAAHIAERIRTTIENSPILVNDRSAIRVTISAGVCGFYENSTDHGNAADAALYAAKGNHDAAKKMIDGLPQEFGVEIEESITSEHSRNRVWYISEGKMKQWHEVS